MAGKIGIRGSGAEVYYYIEADTGESIAIGFDPATGTFNLNASATPDVNPDETTSSFAINPTTGEVVLEAALGEAVTINSDIKMNEAQIVKLTPVDNLSPYVVLATDYYLAVRTVSNTYTIQLPDLPQTGRVFIIKDVDGQAVTNNITVTTVSGLVTIDNSTTFIMNSPYQSAQFIFNGTAFEIF